MNFNKTLSENFKLINTDVVGFNSGDLSANCIRFNFSFYGKLAFADYNKNNIDKGRNSVSFAEAPSELADSFENALETHFNEIVSVFIKTEIEHNSLFAL